MDEPSIIMTRPPYDDSAWRVVIRASNGEFGGVLEFYTDAEELSEFGRRLAEFPIGPDDEAQFEHGSRDGNLESYLLLRASRTALPRGSVGTSFSRWRGRRRAWPDLVHSKQRGDYPCGATWFWRRACLRARA
jgi:hypothetical protein